MKEPVKWLVRDAEMTALTYGTSADLLMATEYAYLLFVVHGIPTRVEPVYGPEPVDDWEADEDDRRWFGAMRQAEALQ